MEFGLAAGRVSIHNTQTWWRYNGEVLDQDEGHCECLGVVDEGTQQQAADQHLQNLDWKYKTYNKSKEIIKWLFLVNKWENQNR